MSDYYDYIFAGTGMSALSLLCRMMDDAHFSDKKIILIDSSTKQKNDRTWSYWEKDPGYFDDLVYKSWKQVKVSKKDWSRTFDLDPYTYKMIRGIDFYEHVFNRIKKHSNISFEKGEILEIKQGNENVVVTDKKQYVGRIVFDSLFNIDYLKRLKGVPVLYQHFKGYVIETPREIEKDVVTFMDFDIPQKETLQFMYVLPFDRNSCLVEHTYFSQYFVSEETYDQALEEYCDKSFGKLNWKVKETEKGVIPMTTANLSETPGKNIIPIGTKGGFTKASSGYTFYFVQKAATRMIEALKENKTPRLVKNRFHFYDALLLRVLANDEGYGHELFSNLFKSTSPEVVFTFLNEESIILQDLSIISKSPTFKFLKALFQEIGYRMR